MQKIFFQWAGVGILSLIGWGVELTPAVTSWVPSSIIWGIAFIWLVGTLVYYLKRRPKQPQPKVSVGGLIGRSVGGKVRRSYFKGKIIVKGKPEEVDAGGLIGKSENTEVEDSSADAEIEYKQD